MKPAAFSLVGSLALLPLACVESQSPAPGQVTVRRIAPASANARVSKWTADHFVWLAPSANGGQVMLLLPGSNGQPANFRRIGSVAAQQGYRTIGLMYPDDLAVVSACARDSDDACMANMRAEIIEGAERSGHVDVDRDNSIDGRLADLLRYLAREYPSESWETFLATDGAPKWDRIAVGGLSQGGGHAAYIAKLRAVPRVVMFGAPADGYRGEVAPWMQIGATPADRYFGFRHARDQFISIHSNWMALGLDKFGGVTEVDENTTDFGNAHLFTSDLLPASGSYDEAHPSVFGDGSTPRRAGGAPVYEALWRYLLGTPKQAR
jgi:hypothetical protein